MDDHKIEELANELFRMVVAPTEEESDFHRIRVYRLKIELPKPARQRATTLARALLAEHHSIERANHRLNR